MLAALALLLTFAAAETIDLTYFDGRGRAEQFRLFFASQQIAYNDIRLSDDAFERLKPTFPWGHVPVINTTSQPRYLADTAALNVYLGKLIKSGTNQALWPTDLVQEAILLDYSGASEDLRLSRNSILGTGCGKTPGPKDAQPKFLPIIKEWASYMEKNLKSNGFGAPFLLGKRFTPVDCRVWDCLDQIQGCMSDYPNLYREFSLLDDFMRDFASLPAVAAYLRTRK